MAETTIAHAEHDTVEAPELRCCAECGRSDVALMAPVRNAGRGYEGPAYCLDCNPRFFGAGVEVLAGRLTEPAAVL